MVTVDLTAPPLVAAAARLVSSACGVCGATPSRTCSPGRRPPGPSASTADDPAGAARPAARRSSRASVAPAGCTPPGCSDPTARVVVVREDVGRHNAVDKVVGSRMLAQEPVPPVLVLSGRIGFELVQKAVVSGVAAVVAVGAPTSLAVALAQRGRAAAGRLHPRRALRGVRRGRPRAHLSRPPDSDASLALPDPSARPVTGVGPTLCRCALLASTHAHPAHLRLAPGPVLPRRGMLAAPGGVRRPPARDRGASRSTWWWSRATSTTGRCRPSTPWRWPTRPSPGWPPPAPGWWSPAATTTPPAGSASTPGSIDAAGRAPAHRPRAASATRCCSRTSTARSPSTGCPTSSPTLPPSAWELPARSHQAAVGEAMRRVRADLAGRPGTRSVVLAHAFVAGGASRSDSERDISVGGVSAGAGRRSSTASTTSRWATCTAAHAEPRPVRYSGLAAGLLLLRGRPTSRAPGWSTSAPTAWPAPTFVDGPGAAPTGPAARHARGAAGRPRHHAARDAWVQATLTDAGPAGAGDGRGCGAASRTRWRWPSTPAGAPRRAAPAARARRRPQRPPRSRSTSSTDVRGAAPDGEESALLPRGHRRAAATDADLAPGRGGADAAAPASR